MLVKFVSPFVPFVCFCRKQGVDWQSPLFQHSVMRRQSPRGIFLLTLLCLVGQRFFVERSAAETAASNASIAKAPFGTTKEGDAVDMFTLRNTNGLTAKVLTYGAIIYSFETPDRTGLLTNVTANCESLADYQQRSP